MSEEEPQPSSFGKRLAHTEKAIRDAAVRTLTKWLVSNETITDLELRKLWKGLFYCFWMSDKPIIQQHLAEKLAGLTLQLKNDVPMRYLAMFWETIVREWYGIDRLRLDKFYMLLRKFHATAFRYLEMKDWEEGLVREWMKMITTVGPLRMNDIKVPASLVYHTIEVYLEELENGAEKKVPPATTTLLLEPFFAFLRRDSNSVANERVTENILYKILEKHQAAPSAMTDDESTEPQLAFDVAEIGRRIFEVAIAPDTLKKNRPDVIALYKKFAAVVDCGVDESQLARDEKRKPGVKPSAAPKKKKSSDGNAQIALGEAESIAEEEGTGDDVEMSDGNQPAFATNGKRKLEPSSTSEKETPKKKKRVKGGKKESVTELQADELENGVSPEGTEKKEPKAEPPKTTKCVTQKKAAESSETAEVTTSAQKKAVQWEKKLANIKVFEKFSPIGPEVKATRSSPSKPALKPSSTPNPISSNGTVGSRKSKRARAADYM
ncbi:hypothetical protein HK104_004368 [Borealophlyctis nickersoniae]|nr:hypothetical protein HK104_004368 [Borealophlyctis nickersoniae]